MPGCCRVNVDRPPDEAGMIPAGMRVWRGGLRLTAGLSPEAGDRVRG